MLIEILLVFWGPIVVSLPSMGGSAAPTGGPDTRLFYDAFKASPIGMALENMEGQPVFVNQALCAMLGFSEEELCRKHCVEFSPREDAAKDWALFEQLRAGLLKQYHLEKRFFRRDGSLFRGRLSISLLDIRPYPLVIAMVEEIGQGSTAQPGALESYASLQKTLGQLIRGQEEERTRVARELHNGVNDPLLLLLANLDRLQQDLPESAGDGVSLKIAEARRQLLEVTKNVHGLSHHLHSWTLEYLGLAKAAARFCKDFGSQEHAQIDFTSESVPKELPNEISLCLFRFLQDALQFVLEKSASRRVHVSLGVRLNEVHLEVSDPGRSFLSEQIVAERSVSISSMRERLKLINGKLSIESQGTALHACAPLGPK